MGGSSRGATLHHACLLCELHAVSTMIACYLQEQQYILTEAAKLFRANRQTAEASVLEKQVFTLHALLPFQITAACLNVSILLQILEGELRLQYARQYQIPYPRLEHKTQVIRLAMTLAKPPYA